MGGCFLQYIHEGSRQTDTQIGTQIKLPGTMVTLSLLLRWLIAAAAHIGRERGQSGTCAVCVCVCALGGQAADPNLPRLGRGRGQEIGFLSSLSPVWYLTFWLSGMDIAHAPCVDVGGREGKRIGSLSALTATSKRLGRSQKKEETKAKHGHQRQAASTGRDSGLWGFIGWLDGCNLDVALCSCIP
ncbi:uncharacterized protein BO97DRAFT_126552 [Aspergillus homomorphus CBS 101889]|uniref:Uncharacterized protein n=1 Tax=Aspergillus homomorphus (strain CBS 101889) TaxID=1450537 RepID=A0A395HRL6_ASPHC|nr:hypothetical protein BO97DRAFT_126552 [Aspergillus homomorphus CBS 101889]RAL10457.1 hypothetical protein BO97DRAFT_126552 [Aspergillus homomorphus CBS 101889]